MFDALFGGGQYAVKMLLAFIVVFGLLALALWIVRRFSGERLGGGAPRGRQPRLAVIDAATVDSRRRLVLIRRDNVEHLVMIGGPTDLVVESSIVRAGAPAREMVPPRPLPSAEALPRPATVGEASTWPLQPESTSKNEPLLRAEPPLRPLRPQSPSEEAPARSGPEPDVPPSPARERRSRNDPLSGLAEELGRVPAAEPPRVEPPPPRPAPRREPRGLRMQAAPATAPPGPPGDGRFASPADQNLAEMAQRLEAALRRPGKGEEARPSTPAPVPEPSGEEAREASAPPDTAPAATRTALQPASPEALPVPAPRNEPRPTRIDGKPPPAKSLYDSLEQEMASLLGRPNGKN